MQCIPFRRTGAGLAAAVLSVSVALPSSASAAPAPSGRPFPMTVVASGAEGVTMLPDPAAFAALQEHASVVLEDVPIAAGETVDVLVDRVPLASPGALVAVDGFVRPEPPGADLSLWSGRVLGAADSEVFLAFSEHGSRGWIRAEGRRIELVAAPRSGGDWSTTWSRFVPVDPLAPRPAAVDFCRSDALSKETGPSVAPWTGSGVPPLHVAGGAITPIYELQLAVETDHQFFQVFQNLAAAETYALTLVGAVSDRYREEVGVIFTLPYLGLYTSNVDPWTQADQGGSSVDVLHEFRDKWKNGAAPVPANLYAMLSGADLGGGVAWLNALCSAQYGFSVSGDLGGNGIFPPAQGNPGNWDFEVVAHELGHNFGSPHTHDYCPVPLDECASSSYYGSCQNQRTCISNGTIMSYCHTCPGGMSNMTLHFHPVVRSVIRSVVVASCLGLFEGVAGAESLGQSLSGSNGVPTLAVGEDHPSGKVEFEVKKAPKSRPGLLVLGSSTAGVPFAGGTLVPAPDVVLPVSSSAVGTYALAAPLPPAFSAAAGVTLFAQVWFEDPVGPHGAAATNAVAFELVAP